MSENHKIKPADLQRCQAEFRSGSFMTLGPREWIRCGNAPTTVVRELKPGADGQHGEMSLCEDCLTVAQRSGHVRHWELFTLEEWSASRRAAS